MIEAFDQAVAFSIGCVIRTIQCLDAIPGQKIDALFCFGSIVVIRTPTRPPSNAGPSSILQVARLEQCFCANAACGASGLLLGLGSGLSAGRLDPDLEALC